MDDAFIMRGSHSARCLNGNIERLAHGQRTALHALAQGFAFEQLGDQVRRAIVRADVVDGENVGMIQRPRRRALPAQNRRRRSASFEKEAGSTLMATSRPSLASVARYTSPMPPAPMAAVMR
jgi:hypothetical protein